MKPPGDALNMTPRQNYPIALRSPDLGYPKWWDQWDIDLRFSNVPVHIAVIGAGDAPASVELIAEEVAPTLLGSAQSWSVVASWGSWVPLAAEPSRRGAQRSGFFQVLISPRPTPGWTSSFQRASVKLAMPLSFVQLPL